MTFINEKSDLERVVEYAKLVSFPRDEAIRVYGEYMALNRRRAYQRTTEHIYIQKMSTGGIIGI